MKKGSKIALAVMSAAIIAGSAAAFGGCGEKKKTINITGSTSVNEVMEVLAQKYEKDVNNKVRIQLNAQGSGAGIQDVIAKRNDFGMASRALKDEEKSEGIVEKQLCIDGIVLAVSKDCGATKVTNDQIYALAMDGTAFEDNGATVNALAGREASSGTREAFDEKVYNSDGKSIKKLIEEDNKSYSSAVSENNSTGTSINKITSDTHHRTVAYISMGSYLANTSTLKALEFMARNQDAYVAPSVETVRDGSYKMQRPFMIVTRADGSMSAEAKEFYEWLWSDDAMDIIESKGYVIQQ